MTIILVSTIMDPLELWLVATPRKVSTSYFVTHICVEVAPHAFKGGVNLD